MLRFCLLFLLSVSFALLKLRLCFALCAETRRGRLSITWIMFAMMPGAGNKINGRRGVRMHPHTHRRTHVHTHVPSHVHRYIDVCMSRHLQGPVACRSVCRGASCPLVSHRGLAYVSFVFIVSVLVCWALRSFGFTPVHTSVLPGAFASGRDQDAYASQSEQ